jgi:hypothetical protein
MRITITYKKKFSTNLNELANNLRIHNLAWSAYRYSKEWN